MLKMINIDRTTSWIGRIAKGALMIIGACALSACVAQIRNHGYLPSDEALAKIVVGRDTKDTVREVVGPPQAEGLLAASGWYYVRSEFQHLGAFEPKEIDRQVLAISFNDSGVVTNVERFGLDEGRVIVLSQRVTTSNVQGTTFLSQLFGNLGQISAEQLLQ
ncbi:outer membrane protein assembly factor BamE [Pacificibacter sp. AS14]|uniref:outer membrane protein assembly factor BamE n=1 Tax=Pacificibacter sp. AS14 TaxID=3135785 RepID=UPI00316DA7A7